MAIERLKVADIEKWGNLVKRWATGAQPRPATLDEFKSQCVAAGAGVTVPSYVTGFELVQSTKEKLLLRLPPKELVEDTEADLRAGATYMLPDFYAELFDRPAGLPPPGMPPGEAGKMKVHALRVGDYTMSFCA